MVASGSVGQGSLRRVVGSIGLFVIAFGSLIGSAWIIILRQWLELGGPLGAIVGITAAGVVMAIITLSYAELMSRMPVAGGEIVYAFEVFGFLPAYVVAWLLILPLVGNLAFEGIALSWIVSDMFPTIGRYSLYRFAGANVSVLQVAIGAIVTVVIAAQNCLGMKNAVRFQGWLTWSFFAIALVAVLWAMLLGRPGNLQPLLHGDGPRPWWLGSLTIFGTGVVWFGGVMAVPQAIEERMENVSFGSVAWAMVVAIALATGFYILAILSVAMSHPWRQLLGEDIVTVAAFRSLAPGGILAWAVLVAGAIALVKLWNVAFVMAARAFMVMGRAQFLPSRLAFVHPKFGTPTNAIVLLAVLNLIGIALGSGAILPILLTCSICVAFTIFVALSALVALRIREPVSPANFSTPGGWISVLFGLAGIAGLFFASLLSPWASAHGRMPFEWVALLVWGFLGLVWFLARRRRFSSIAPAETRKALFIA